jgi:sulfur carrier protein
MRLRINGKPREVAATMLSALLEELGYQCGHIATAVNGEHVPFRKRDNFFLENDDRIEILSPMEGG